MKVLSPLQGFDGAAAALDDELLSEDEGVAVTGTPTAGQVPIADGLGGAAWGDMAGTGGGSIVGSPITEVSITGATTLTGSAFGSMHVCSGTSADYTVGLPAVSGNTGKTLGIRMSNALTKLVTLDANGGELIDGQATRVMWAGESAILLCDGTGWNKIAGRAKSLTCTLRTTADQSIPGAFASIEVLNLNQADVDTSALMGDTTAHTITARRTGAYKISSQLFYANLQTAARLINYIYKNGSAYLQAEAEAATTSSYPAPSIVAGGALAAGDVLTLRTHNSSASARDTLGSSAGAACSLSVSEDLTW